MRSGVYETVGRPSVRPSVCLSQQQQWQSAGLLLSALRAGAIDRKLQARYGCLVRAAGAGAQQQMRAAPR